MVSTPVGSGMGSAGFVGQIAAFGAMTEAGMSTWMAPVSYTHLDVYKRQPERKQINISEPIVVRHGSRYGVRMKATAPSIHMIQSMVETEIAPIVGSEQQAKDLVDYIESAAQKEQDGICLLYTSRCV